MSTLTPELGRFCKACQAIPAAGFCNLVGCPNVFGARTLSQPQRVFARRLAMARAGLEMSQEELSRRSGLPASAISHYESGRRGPSIDNLVRIVRAMPGLNANWLLGLTSDATTDDYEDGYSDAMRDAQEALIALSDGRRSPQDETAQQPRDDQ